MDHFHFVDGALHGENVPLARIAAEVGTPAYVYSRATITEHVCRIRAAFSKLDVTLCYSVKCCANLHICKLLHELGTGFDVVSGGEIHRARLAGGNPADFVFAGVGKTDAEIEQAIDAGVGLFNVESEAELANLIEIAGRRGAVVSAALRVNPDVDPQTHRYTTTGKRENKFGVDLERARAVFERFGRSSVVRLRGLHIHIGSPVNSAEPYVQAIRACLALADDLRAAGFPIDTFDLGGGFGADYETDQAPSAADYADAIVPLLAGRGLRVHLEPGRSIMANAGILLTRTLYLKQSGEKHFAIVDASMADLIRPALYQANHFVWPVAPGRDFVPTARRIGLQLPGTTEVDIVGPVCESGDFLATGRWLPPLRRGDLIAVFSAGAYGFSMSSQYNSRPRAAEVLVDGDTFRLIRRRETYDDLLAPELDCT